MSGDLSSQSGKRVLLLTGASGTFGEEFCRRFASQYAIAAVYHGRVPALPSQETTIFDPFDPHVPLVENDHPVFGIQADVSTPAGCEWAVQAALDRFGCIDVVVHAAAHAVWGSVLDSEDVLASAERQFAVNVLAPLRITTTVARWDWIHHDPQDSWAAGRNVICLSSTAGVRLYPGNGQSVYGASKAALNHLACHLAEELQPLGVRVNVLAPDSFPEPVDLADVIEAVVQLDQSRRTGCVVLLDADGRRWLTLPRAGTAQGAGAARVQ